MKQYEHIIKSILTSEIEENLDEFGRNGWELCGVVFEGTEEKQTAQLFFKKETDKETNKV